MKRVFLLSFLFTVCLWCVAADRVSDKLSITTQMFLDERDGELSLDPELNAMDRLDALLDLQWRRPYMKVHQRLIARPSTVDGTDYISAFVRLDDNADVSALETLGVEVQCRFDGGLITCEIPVDAIEEVAALGNVRRVNVAQLMQKTTNMAREKSHVDDVLTHSMDAMSLGITTPYDGTGVLLGIIDTGIDFQHIAFKDKNGNYRSKRAYLYNGTRATEYTSSNMGSATTDDSSEEHGTHTSSIAGGSSVIISGNSVTVTDDHSMATYGGMAPGTELYLAGINGLSNTYLANAFQKICTYADQQGMPVVVSNSWGSQYGPHDGTGDFASVIDQYFGDAHPGHICLFAASNDAGKTTAKNSGYYVTKSNASSNNPLNTVLNSHTYSNTSDGYMYSGICLNAWARNTSTTALNLKIMVLNATTGEVLTTVTVTPSANGTSISGLSKYYSGSLIAYKDYIDSNKTQVILYAEDLTSTGYSKVGDIYQSNYVLALQIYPASGTSTIDAWGGTYGYFGNTPANKSYNWVAGSDDCSVSDEATNPNVISIGAYVTKNSVTDYKGVTHDLSSDYTMGDIAYFSSYATAAACPTGQQLPWICAPGATIASAVNHLHTADSYIDDAYADYGMYRVNSNTTYPYGTMEGTSMATPAAAGIVALWLQAGKEAGKSMTTSYVKEVMQQTAMRDAFVTTGANASHFGQGKIDALAGIQYILGTSSEPGIYVRPSSLTFKGKIDQTITQTVTVNGLDAGAVTASVDNTLFSVTPSTLSAAAVAAGAPLTVTFRSDSEGTFNGTLTLTDGTLTTTVPLTATVRDGGTASDIYLDVQRYATINEAGATVAGMSSLYKYTENEDRTAWLTLPAYGAYKADAAQNWIDTSGTNTTSGTWTASAPFAGSSAYFSDTAYAMGSTGNGASTTTVDFYVTNVTEVRALMRGYSSRSSYANLNVYMCTENTDGTLTVSSTTTGSQRTSSNSPTPVTVGGLDASAIYKVSMTCTRGLLYEVAFKTTLPEDLTPALTVNPTSLTFNTLIGTPSSQTVTLKGSHLTDAVAVTLSGEGFSTEVTTLTAAQAEAGQSVEVTFTPTATGTFTGTLTFSTADAEDVTVSLTANVTSNIRYKSTADDTWHFLTPDEDGGYTLNDGAYYTLEVIDGESNVDIDYVRSFSTADVWMPWFMPFDLPVTAELLEEYTFASFEGIYFADGASAGEWQIGVVRLQEGDVVYANVPYVVRAKTTGSRTIAVKGTTIYPTADRYDVSLRSASYDFTFSGTYSKKVASESDLYWYYMSGGKLSRATKAGTSLGACRFFVTTDARTDNPYAGPHAPDISQSSISIRAFDDATEIEQLVAEQEENDVTVVYDLLGRRVVNMSEGGIYIINGKKTYVK